MYVLKTECHFTFDPGHVDERQNIFRQSPGLHRALAADLSDEVPAFETAALEAAGVDYAPVPPRYRTTYFRHIFNNDYSAGYYAYLWSEVLARDTGAWMHAHGGLTRANGDELRRSVLSRGRTAEPLELFRNLCGRGPDIDPLRRYRGLDGG